MWQHNSLLNFPHSRKVRFPLLSEPELQLHNLGFHQFFGWIKINCDAFVDLKTGAASASVAALVNCPSSKMVGPAPFVDMDKKAKGLGAVWNTTKVEPGAIVAIFGLGTVGLTLYKKRHQDGGTSCPSLLDLQVESAQYIFQPKTTELNCLFSRFWIGGFDL
ncbi:hypothetical protein V6N12_055440 [Hibiscus sabdariffa]|uniref:Uncharacterized protein n=1 Tax=Hibiscus sabdariffa TaxID=183260 RepID=A0ABR2BTP6_9ROSI